MLAIPFGYAVRALETDGLPLSMLTDDTELGGLQRVLLEERPRLLRFIAARGLPDDAEDILHDLWQKLRSGPQQPVADPVSYLFRAADNLVRDRRRSGARRIQRQEDWHAAVGSDVQEPLGERAIIARERLREVEAALGALGPRVNEALRRFRVDGVGQAAIAREMTVSVSSIEKDLRKAYDEIARLKAKFDAE